ncbi:MAG: hypothetical protein CM1200mP28_15510 [Deltaproteobacteria bacterium]|nr:MAG: hypothetical protein CM1200mP28_15510 [Deltaproteobacteria bacterium]
MGEQTRIYFEDEKNFVMKWMLLMKSDQRVFHHLLLELAFSLSLREVMKKKTAALGKEKWKPEIIKAQYWKALISVRLFSLMQITSFS